MIASLCCLAAFAQTPLGQELESFRTQNQIAGLSVAAWRDGNEKFAQAYGYRDVASSIHARPGDLFRLASVSKPVTAIGVMALVEGGLVDLDDRAAKHLPWLPAEHTYTLRQLLSHTAGVTHYRGAGDPTNPCYDHFPTQKSASFLFVQAPLVAPPGGKYSYSTHAYTLVGAVVESVTGMRFEEYMRRRITPFAGPGGLDCEDLTEPAKTNRTSLYTASTSGPVAETKREDLSWKYAGGGMEATATGLARFGDALMAGKIIKLSSLGELWTRQKTSDGNETNYGLGFDVQPDGTRLHTGAQQGARSVFLIDPAKKLTVVILSNTAGSYDLASLAKRIAARY